MRSFHFNILQHFFSDSLVCWALLSLTASSHILLFQLSAATERRSPNVSMKTFQGFNSPDFGLSQKTEARSRMAALKHSHAQTVLSGLLFLFEHTVYPCQAASLMYLSHSWALSSSEMKLRNEDLFWFFLNPSLALVLLCAICAPERSHQHRGRAAMGATTYLKTSLYPVKAPVR